jgi:tetratricopeptide (TPR) repeat protein
MDNTLAQNAISFALAGDWEEAASTNLQIISQNSQDTDALNRLARAYAELGKIEKAREALKKVLSIDPVNPIAKRCLDKLKGVKKSDIKTGRTTSAESFLEEPGKTKILALLCPGDSSVIASLDSGDIVKLLAGSHRVSVTTLDGKYIGRLPDDLGVRLANLIKAGNKYEALIKSTGPKEITVFIRETEKGDANDAPSFPSEKIDYVSFTPPELVHKDTPVMEQSENLGED